MDETEMTALKKAYAEIILNTAKEAAARVIVSERKADSLQRDLSATKEEAIRILMRIKQMIGSKVSEAEKKSLIQQKRADELEAQLHEAEDIVSSLRAELYGTQAELERLSRNQQRPIHNPSYPEESAKPEGTNEQQCSINNYVTSGVARLQPQHESKTDWKSSVSDKSGYDNACYKEYCYANDAGKTDVTSIIVRSTEPEMYRNGCTQRIRACDRNHLNGHLPLSEQPDDLKCEKLVEAENVGERIGVVVPSSGGEATENKENTPAEGKEIINNVKAILRHKRKIALASKKNRAQLEFEPALIRQACVPCEVSQSLVRTSGSVNCSITETNIDGKANQESDLEGRLALTISSAAGTSEKESDSVATTDKDMDLGPAMVLITQESISKTDIGETNIDGKANQESDLERRLALTIPSAAGTCEKESDSVATTDKDMDLGAAMVLITQESVSKTGIRETNSDGKANQESHLEGRLALTIPSAAGTSEKESDSVATTDMDLGDAMVLITQESVSKTDIWETNGDGKANQESQLEGRLTLTIPSAAGTSEKESDSVATTDMDMDLGDAMVLITQESGSKTDIGLPCSEEELENPTSPQQKSNAPASDSSDAIPVLSPKDRIVKYTFQRKRKRESITNGDVNSSPQKDIPEPRTGKGEGDALDGLTTESS